MASALIALCLCPGALAAGDISVRVDGQAVSFTDAAPFIDGSGRTLCPLRAVADAMGLLVTWDAAAREAVFSRTEQSEYGEDYENTLHFSIGGSARGVWTVPGPRGNENYTLAVPMDTSAVIVSGRTYAPVRYLAEYFGFDVGWDGGARQVTVDPCYISEPGYAMDVENGIVLRLYPSTGYEKVASIELLSGKLNGKTAAAKVSDMGSIHGSVFEYVLTLTAPVAVATLESTLRITLKSGAVLEKTYAQSYSDFFSTENMPVMS